MVNLMKFRARASDGSGTGWEAYLRYSKLTAPMIKARGGTIIWAGEANTVAVGDPEADSWDYIALVYYPTRAAFLDMLTSRDYVERSDPVRTAACERHVIIATTQAYAKPSPA